MAAVEKVIPPLNHLANKEFFKVTLDLPGSPCFIKNIKESSVVAVESVLVQSTTFHVIELQPNNESVITINPNEPNARKLKAKNLSEKAKMTKF